MLEDDGQRHDATTDELLAQIREIRAMGAATVVLTGGEVTLRQDFLLLLEAALDEGLRVVVQTNGRLLGRLVPHIPCAPDRLLFAVAVHGPSPAVHDRITRRRGSFAQTLVGIHTLLEYGHPVIGKVVLSRLNTSVALSTLARLSQEGVRRAIVAFPHALGFSQKAFATVVPRYSEIAEELIACARSAEREGLSLEFETVPCCVAAAVPAVWLRSRDLRLAVGNIDPGFIRAPGRDDLQEWETERRQIKWKGESCARCLLGRACEGPWIEYVEAFGDREFQPVEDPALLECLS